MGGGDLGIQRKLEIQPLNSGETDRFLHECLPEHQDQVRQLLQRDNRDLSRTPFVLWMLYHLLQETGTIAETLGEAFRQFFRFHCQNYKEDAPVPEERRKAWNSWMEHLAFTMLSSPDPLDPGLVITKEKAENVLIKRFGELQGNGSRILELEKYYLLAPVSDRETSFKHQLIQEYYAAERLHYKLRTEPQLLHKQKGRKYAPLQMQYLNYRKWLGVLILTISLMKEEEKTHILDIVKLAVSDIDLSLAAKLAGAAKLCHQQFSIPLIEKAKISLTSKFLVISRKKLVDTPDWLKIEILEETQSPKAFPLLRSFLRSPEKIICAKAASALGRLGDRGAEQELLRLSRVPDEYVKRAADSALWNIESEEVAPKAFFRDIKRLLKDRNKADQNPEVEEAAQIQEERKQWAEKLRQNISNSDPSVRRYVAFEIERQSFSELLSELIQMANDPEPEVRRYVVTALEKLGTADLAPRLLSMLDDPDLIVVANTCTALGTFGKDIATPKLINILESHDAFWIRRLAAKALGNLNDERAIVSLTNALQRDESFFVRWDAAKALASLGSNNAISTLKEGLYHPSREVCLEAISNLAKYNYPKLAHSLVPMLKDPDPIVRSKASQAISTYSNKEVIPKIVKLFSGADSEIVWVAVDTLKKFDVDSIVSILPHLNNLLPSDSGQQAFTLIKDIQSRCGFYNFTMQQEAVRYQEQISIAGEGSQSLSTELLSRIHQVASETNQRTLQMSNEPKNDFSGANFHAPVNFGDNPTGDFIGTQNNFHNDAEVQGVVSDLKILLTHLQDQHPSVNTESEALAIIDAEFTEIRTSRNHKLATLQKQLLNPERHLQACKAAAGEVAKHYLEDSVWAKTIITYIDKLSEEPGCGA
jgi:HEAT repeat protein